MEKDNLNILEKDERLCEVMIDKDKKPDAIIKK